MLAIQSEKAWNEENRQWGLPPVFLADWTALPNDIENIESSFKFLQENFTTNKKLQALLNKVEEEQRDTKTCKMPCRFCGPKKTSNCCVIRGRQKPLIIFRDVAKGWSLSAACEYKLRFASHACVPNCESRTDCNAIVFKAKRRILRGEELTIDYFVGKSVQSVDEENRGGCLAFFPYCNTNDENIEPIVIDDKEDEDDDVVFVEVVNRNAEKSIRNE
ncbi:hypothetical protein PRIPAC_90405 [Pristionchus pacificus]|uniref:SET domain-containing protein n=1 Tax=Pristionchus pacificus TaxID=54126 RepID=A0A2A6B8S6_PRIPA|nr:hypothetical protein PRIPAC_90405 [Pristionchus pacificus]|eukprot:PDM62282.1 SET domain-containing protein [Pristionchus pacificus]